MSPENALPTDAQRALLQARCKLCGGGSRYHYVGVVRETQGNLEDKISVGDVLVEHKAIGKRKKKEIFYIDSKHKLQVGSYILDEIERIPIIFKTRTVKA